MRNYAPYYRRIVHTRDGRPETRLTPVFSGILFVQDWRGWPKYTIRRNRGLMRRGNGNIATISDDDIWVIMRKEREMKYDEVRFRLGGKAVVRDDIEVGDRVTFDRLGQRVEGVLAEALSPNGLAVVRALFFGRETRTTVPAAELVLVEG